MTTLNINLLPPELQKKSKGKGKGGGASSLSLGNLPDTDVLIPVGIGLAVGLALCAIPWGIENFYFLPKVTELDNQIAQLDQDINKYSLTLKEIRATADREQELTNQLRVLQDVAGSNMSWADVLDELRSITPANLWFERISTESTGGKAGLSIGGTALDYNSVAYFFRNLQNAEHFEEPELDTTDMAANNATGVNTVKFSLKCKIKKTKKV